MRKEALVVGINTYHFVDNGKSANLEASARDAEDMAQILKDYGSFNVKRLPSYYGKDGYKVSEDKQVEQEELKQAIVNLFNPEDNDYPDIALLYFQGHGWKDENNNGYLCTSLTYPNNKDYGLNLDFLRSQLTTSKVSQQIVFLDCCYSG